MPFTSHSGSATTGVDPTHVAGRVAETRVRRRTPVPSGLVRSVRSRDGVSITYERIGQGPPLILVDGALCHRKLGPGAAMAKLLARHFTVFTYDRRGRGESGDADSHGVAREVADFQAVLRETDGDACVWGHSSGGVLALEAANRVGGVRKLVLYEAPFIVDDGRAPTEHEWAAISEAIAEDRRSDAVRTFLRLAGVPGLVRALMRLSPMWPKLEAVARTLPYDGALVRDYQRGKPLPAGLWPSVRMPVLVMAGGKSPAWLRSANQSLAACLPDAQYVALEGETHNVRAKAQVPWLLRFFE